MIFIRYVGHTALTKEGYHNGSTSWGLTLVRKPSLSSALNYPSLYCLSWARRSTKAMPIEFREYVEYCIGLVLTPTPVTSLQRNQVGVNHPERQASSHLRRCIQCRPWKRGDIVAEKLVRHETPAWCPQTAHAVEYHNFNFCTEFLHGNIHIPQL